MLHKFNIYVTFFYALNITKLLHECHRNLIKKDLRESPECGIMEG